MPSKSCSAAVASTAPLPATGWVLGAWSAISPHWRRAWELCVQASAYWVTSAVTRLPMYSANDSLSHRSSHHFGVTMLPNHWWAISWARVVARWMRTPRVTRDVKTSGSRNVTHPGFSIAPALNSGTNAWWYSPNG